MKWLCRFLFMIMCWQVAQAPVLAASYGVGPPLEYFTCGYGQVSAQFTAKGARYSFSGTCIHTPSQKQVPWSAEGVHEVGTGKTDEKVVLNGLSPYRGEFRIGMICASGPSIFDPWLTDNRCANITISAQGEFASQKTLLDEIYRRAVERGGPATASFPYDRNPLLAKRTADLKAEADAAAARAKTERRAGQLQQAAIISPMIHAPAAGQRFLNGTAIPIRLQPSPGSNTVAYDVRIERKDNGNWVHHTGISILGTQAHSGLGFTEFGGGAPPAMRSVPGAWRLRARASLPQQSGWSQWVEFHVMAPATNKALQPSTRSFGK